MRNIILLAALAVSACASSIKPPPECVGEVRKINPETVSVAGLSCTSGAA